MPEQTYNIGYGTNDFFYDSNNTELLKTVPFDKGNLVAWAQTKDNTIPTTAYANINIFDPKITAVVFVNKEDFMNTYLPGNIIVNNLTNFSNFNARTIDLTLPRNIASYSVNPNLTSGSITIQSSMNIPDTTYDLSLNGSSLEYQKNILGTLGDDISLNGVFSKAEMPYPEPNGSTSYISVNTANPRCKFQKSCREKHWHFKSCTTQTYINKDGSSYCKCVCKGPKTLDNKEHQHCSPFNIRETNANGTMNEDAFKATISALIKKITVSIKQQPDVYMYNANGKWALPYQKFTEFDQDDKTIRTLLYDYYYQLNRNIQLRNQIISNDSLDTTAKQALLDANVNYKKEYLHLFNIFSGILFVSGYIYVMYKSKPK